jgi:hypothetical protein
MRTQLRPITKIAASRRNPGQNAPVVSRIAASAHKVTFRIPVLVGSKGNLKTGILGWKAAQKLATGRALPTGAGRSSKQ